MSTEPRNEPNLLIDGEWVPASGGTYEIINPATEQVVGHAPNATAEDALAAARAAKAALPGWSALSADEWSSLMAQAAVAIRAKAPELLPLVIAETGATLAVGSGMQVPVAADRFNRYARDFRNLLQTPLPPQIATATPLAPGGVISGLVNRQPVGVVACITSYNFPMVNMAGKVAPALAAGNTVVVKPAPQDPLAIVELARILDEVGFPKGVINLINSSGPEAGAALVDSPDVDMVSFTGSTQVGTKIMESGGKTMKRLLLELGGKGAAVVLDDADVQQALTCIASTWAFHSGQICTAPTRAVVHVSKVDEVVAGLTKMAPYLQVGDPNDKKTKLGPLISAAQRDRVRAFIDGAGPEGGDVVVDGRETGFDTGFYVGPTLIVGTNAMTCAQQEIFGPVITLIPFEDEEEGIAIANDSEFGLYDYVFSGDTGRAFTVAKQLKAGHVGVNTAQRNHEAPFGGFKMSGVGRDGGDFGVLAYTETQSIIWSA